MTPVKDGSRARDETEPWKSRSRRYDDERSRVREAEEGSGVRPETVPAPPPVREPRDEGRAGHVPRRAIHPRPRPDVHVALYIVSGEGEVVAGKERRNVTEGDLVVVPRKMRRGVKAKTDMIVLHVVSPSPTQADHGDMGERIARGEFELPA